MPDIFVFTASRDEALEHYKKTIENPVPDELITKFLGKEFLQELRRNYPEGPIYVWGATPGPNNVRVWNAMKVGDYAISYQKGKITKLFRIIGKIHNKEFAEYLWGQGRYPDNLGQTWEYMYFLQFIADINKTSPISFRGHTGPLRGERRAKIEALIKEALGKSLDELDSEVKSNIIFTKYSRVLRVKRKESLSKIRPIILTILNQIERGNYYAPDNWTKHRVRIGQAILRAILPEMYDRKCCICGLDIEELLEVAHIKPWAEDPQNRLNPMNCLLLCSLHHKALDKGLIRVENGKVYCTERIRNCKSEAVKEFLLKYHGKEIMKQVIDLKQAIQRVRAYLELT